MFESWTQFWGTVFWLYAHVDFVWGVCVVPLLFLIWFIFFRPGEEKRERAEMKAKGWRLIEKD